MNGTEEPSPPTEKPGCIVRAFIVALPLGLAFMVPLSLLIYYQKKHEPAPATSPYAALLRRDLNPEDFKRYVLELTQESGERSPAQPDKRRDAAASFIESTMDFTNMGYEVQRHPFEAHGRPMANLVAELPGRTKPDEVVLVLADYDGMDAKGIAALMCLAHALAGSEHARTIRFAAVANTGDSDETANGMDQLARRDAGGKRLTKTLVLVSPGVSDASQVWEQAKARPLASMLLGDPLTGMKRILEEIEQEADAP
jgi:hypothetical protein